MNLLFPQNPMMRKLPESLPVRGDPQVAFPIVKQAHAARIEESIPLRRTRSFEPPDLISDPESARRILADLVDQAVAVRNVLECAGSGCAIESAGAGDPQPMLPIFVNLEHARV